MREGTEKELECLKLTYSKPMLSVRSSIAKFVCSKHYKLVPSIRDIFSSPLTMTTVATIDEIEAIVYATCEVCIF